MSMVSTTRPAFQTRHNTEKRKVYTMSNIREKLMKQAHVSNQTNISQKFWFALLLTKEEKTDVS